MTPSETQRLLAQLDRGWPDAVTIDPGELEELRKAERRQRSNRRTTFAAMVVLTGLPLGLLIAFCVALCVYAR